MKRWMLLALSAAMAVGSAHAVAVAWDDLGWESVDLGVNASSKGSATGLSLSPEGFTVCLSMNISNFNPSTWANGQYPSRWPNFLQIGENTANDLSVCTDKDANVRLTGTVTKIGPSGGNDQYGPKTMRVENGTHTLVLTYEAGTVKVYWDSQLAITYEAAEDYRFTEAVTTLHWGERYNSDPNTTDVAKSMAWTVTELKYLANQVADPTAIPEPTALALLALGVAGLALRRRVA